MYTYWLPTRPKLAVSVMVNNLKSVSSRLLRQQNAHLRMQSKTGLLWVEIVLCL